MSALDGVVSSNGQIKKKNLLEVVSHYRQKSLNLISTSSPFTYCILIPDRLVNQIQSFILSTVDTVMLNEHTIKPTYQ
jgi:hypothetical protein